MLRARMSSAVRSCALWLCALCILAAPAVGQSQPTPLAPQTLSVASFNIQFLGQFRIRDDEALADMLIPYDLVFIQELVAPPYPGTFPDGTQFRPDAEAARFFDAMAARGFAFVLSEEDTGSGDQIHLNSSATEWYVAFYRPERVSPAADLVTGFLAQDRSNNPDFERVPYAFGFRAGSEDLVFISTHLKPGPGSAARSRRAHEIASIARWIGEQAGEERDYVVLGDMNIEDCGELEDVLPAGYASLNATCIATNTNPNGPRPYDHVMINEAHTAAEVPFEFGLLNLVRSMARRWDPASGSFPGDPYRHDAFRQLYSDHHAVTFRVLVDGVDDD